MERLSPILMTALSAGLALIPLALAIGKPGSEIPDADGDRDRLWPADIHSAEHVRSPGSVSALRKPSHTAKGSHVPTIAEGIARRVEDFDIQLAGTSYSGKRNNRQQQCVRDSAIWRRECESLAAGIRWDEPALLVAALA